MTTESVCVCGHSKYRHTERLIRTACADYFTGQYLVYECSADGCKCGSTYVQEGYRAVLDWPDSVGHWWVRSEILDAIACAAEVDEDLFRSGMIIEQYVSDGEIVVLIPGLRSGYMNRETFDAPLSPGPARFVKLTEPNPFGAST